jgi:hypothetical protein
VQGYSAEGSRTPRHRARGDPASRARPSSWPRPAAPASAIPSSARWKRSWPPSSPATSRLKPRRGITAWWCGISARTISWSGYRCISASMRPRLNNCGGGDGPESVCSWPVPCPGSSPVGVVGETVNLPISKVILACSRREPLRRLSARLFLQQQRLSRGAVFRPRPLHISGASCRPGPSRRL